MSNIIFTPNGKILYNLQLEKSAIVSGSFNPLHQAHVEMGEKALKDMGIGTPDNKLFFELSVMNPDKGLIEQEEIRKRIAGIIEKKKNAMISMKPFFYTKNAFSQNGYFIMGADTYKRLVNTKYYGNSREQMVISLSDFTKCNNTLVVA